MRSVKRTEDNPSESGVYLTEEEPIISTSFEGQRHTLDYHAVLKTLLDKRFDFFLSWKHRLPFPFLLLFSCFTGYFLHDGF